MNIANQPLSGPISVSSNTLGHISAGIYRSSAGALKELLSNAFDADATTAKISFNPPSFDVVALRDDGTGIERSHFIRLMQSGIGDSDKRRAGVTVSAKGRPLIGRIGIGLLAIAQLCHSFEIVSHHRATRSAFRARVQLVDYLQEEIDSSESKERYEVGTYWAQPLEFDVMSGGTQIIATELKRGFVSRFRKPIPPLLPDAFEAFFVAAVRHDSLRELSEYWRTVWNIGLFAPLPYYDGGPVRNTGVEAHRQAVLRGFDFHVEVDGLELFRPVLLPPRTVGVPKQEDIRVTDISINEQVDGSALRGTGYIYSQGGKSIYPAELRGMLIRIKGVAIGSYDKNFLDYPIVEGPRFAWLSGELNLDDGLEDALNIDRDSFNETHPHYIAVQLLIHGIMDREVRPWLYKNLDDRKQVRDEAAQEERERRITQTVSKYVEGAPQIERVPRRRGREPYAAAPTSPVRVETAAGRIIIDEAAQWPRGRRDRDLAERIAIAFELALEAPDHNEIRRRFYELLAEIFS